MEFELILKIIVVILVVILLVLILFPCHEYFENSQDTLGKKSSVIYSDKTITTDTEYLKKLNPISNDLLIMYRCIEFVKGGIEKVISKLRKQEEDPFFISKKYEIEYTDFSEIEKLIKSSVSELHAYYKNQFYGPIYLLITQYPSYNSISADCIITTQSSPLENSFSPIIQTIDEKCKNLTHPHKRIRCEFYILMPSHHPGNIHDDGKLYLVGRQKESVAWEDILDSMKDLLLPGNSYINNVRSKDKQCFTKCGEIQVDGYICGARNGDTPYKSEVFNTPINNTVEKTHSDYANLYIMNTNGINNLLGTTSQGGMNDLGTLLPNKGIIRETFNNSSYPMNSLTAVEGVTTGSADTNTTEIKNKIFPGDLSKMNEGEYNKIPWTNLYDKLLCDKENKDLAEKLRKSEDDLRKSEESLKKAQQNCTTINTQSGNLTNEINANRTTASSSFGTFTFPATGVPAKKPASARQIQDATNNVKVKKSNMETERGKLYGTCNKEGTLYINLEKRVADLKSKLATSKNKIKDKQEYDKALTNLGKRYKDMDKKCPKAAARYVKASKEYVDAQKKLKMLM